MPMDKKGLTKLMEECGELTQIAAKKAAYIDTDIHPDGKSMSRRMEDEIADVMAASIFVTKKFGLNREYIYARAEQKMATFEEWDKDPNS